MATASSLGPIVERIHGAALDPTQWQAAISAIAAFCGAQCGILYELDRVHPKTDLLASPGIDPGLMRDYEQYYWTLDPWNPLALKGQIGRAALTHEIIPDAEFRRMEFYQGHCRHADVFYSLGSVIDRTADYMVVFGVQRGHRRQPFARETADIVEHFIMPHLRQAYLAQRAIRAVTQKCATLIETLHLIPSPVLVVDGAGRLEFANHSAEVLLAANDGLRLVRGAVVSSSREQSKLFAETLANLARGLDGARAPRHDIAIDRPTSDRPLLLRFALLPHDNGGEATRIAIFVDLAAGAAQGIEKLQRTLRLTAAETRLLTGLVAGKSLSALSDQHRVSVNTLRVQLRQLFQKTGTHRQAELVRFALTAGGMRPAGLTDDKM